MSAPPDSSLSGRRLGALLTVQLLFGLHPIASKLAFPAFGPGGVCAARAIGAAVVFQIARWIAQEPAMDRSLHARVLLASMLGIVSNQLLFLYGLQRTTATHASLLIVTVPVATLFVAILARRERPLPHRVVGIGIAFVGAALVVSGRGSVEGGDLVGDLMIVANAFAYGCYLVLSRDLLERVPPLTLAAWLFTWGAPAVLLVTGIPTVNTASNADWGALAFIVAGPTIGTYFLNLFALRSLPSSVVAVFVCLQPLITGLLAGLVLGETVTPRILLAGALTIVGVIVATRPTPPARSGFG